MLRAVLYCRCSTEEESQVNALQNQILEGEACVRGQGWRLVDRYVELRSGTTTKGRTEYNRLYEDLLTDRFDVIVIKSQDRLMRNVRDWYLFLDRMQTCGKRLFIYLEGKFYTNDDALITGIKAILAEDYSRELSKKMNHAHRNRQKNGGRAMLTSKTFGFRKCPDGSVQIVEEEAEIIREIFAYCIAGYGCRSIANIYRNQGYVKKTGTPLSGAFINKLIRNPLYKGVMLMNRQHFDFETKRVVRVPEKEWIYGEGAVPPIVEAAVWESANAALTERAGKYRRNRTNRQENSAGKFELSGKLICAECGSAYYRVQRYRRHNKTERIAEWKCSRYLENGRRACGNIHLDETALLSLLESAGERYYHLAKQDKESILCCAAALLRKALEDQSGIGREKMEEEERRVRSQKELLLTKLLDGVISDQDYQEWNSRMDGELREILEKKDKMRQQERKLEKEQRIEKICSRLRDGGLEKAIVNSMLQDIRQIRVHEWKLEICFDPTGFLSFSGEGVFGKEREEGSCSQDCTIWADYPFPPGTERGRFLERRRIMEVLKTDPELSARRIAELLGESPYMIRNRLGELTKGGYLRFRGKGSHGRWEILKELSNAETARKNGEL